MNLRRKQKILGAREQGVLGYFVSGKEAENTVLDPGYVAILENRRDKSVEYKPVRGTNLGDQLTDTKRVFIVQRTLQHQLGYTAHSADQYKISGTVALTLQPDYLEYSAREVFMKNVVKESTLTSLDLETIVTKEDISALIGRRIEEDEASLVHTKEKEIQDNIETTLAKRFHHAYGFTLNLGMSWNNSYIDQIRENTRYKQMLEQIGKQETLAKREHTLAQEHLSTASKQGGLKIYDLSMRLAEVSMRKELELQQKDHEIKLGEKELRLKAQEVRILAFSDAKVGNQYVSYYETSISIATKDLEDDYARRKRIKDEEAKTRIARLEAEQKLAEKREKIKMGSEEAVNILNGLAEKGLIDLKNPNISVTGYSDEVIIGSSRKEKR